MCYRSREFLRISYGEVGRGGKCSPGCGGNVEARFRLVYSQFGVFGFLLQRTASEMHSKGLSKTHGNYLHIWKSHTCAIVQEMSSKSDVSRKESLNLECGSHEQFSSYPKVTPRMNYGPSVQPSSQQFLQIFRARDDRNLSKNGRTVHAELRSRSKAWELLYFVVPCSFAVVFVPVETSMRGFACSTATPFDTHIFFPRSTSVTFPSSRSNASSISPMCPRRVPSSSS